MDTHCARWCCTDGRRRLRWAFCRACCPSMNRCVTWRASALACLRRVPPPTRLPAGFWPGRAEPAGCDVCVNGLCHGGHGRAARRADPCAVPPDPIIAQAEQKQGLRVVVDARTIKASHELFGGTMPASCLYAAQPFVQKRPDQVQALVNAMVHALKWLQTAEPADIVKALPASYLATDRPLYLAAFHRIRETFSPNGMMPDDAPSGVACPHAGLPGACRHQGGPGAHLLERLVRKARQNSTFDAAGRLAWGKIAVFPLAERTAHVARISASARWCP